MKQRVIGRVLALLVGGLLSVAPAQVQSQLVPAGDPGGSVRSRADLEGALRYNEQILASPAYSDRVKSSVRADSERIRERLTDGDFKLGDRIVLSVQGEEETLPDTVAVQAGPIISLPLFGEIPLAGVLRSEISAHIREALTLYIRDPVVRAEGLMRISVLGSVGQPGFYVVPADMLISETLMVAGGPSPTADIRELRVERGADIVLEGEELQEADRRGLTLDQLNLQAGDRLFLPQESQGGGNFLSNMGMIIGLVTSIALIVVQVSG